MCHANYYSMYVELVEVESSACGLFILSMKIHVRILVEFADVA